MSSPTILALFPMDVDILLKYCWHVGKADVELLFLPECGVVCRAMGTLLLGLDLTVILGVVWV